MEKPVRIFRQQGTTVMTPMPYSNTPIIPVKTREDGFQHLRGESGWSTVCGNGKPKTSRMGEIACGNCTVHSNLMRV